MAKQAFHYAVFKTRWGWFGLLGDDVALWRTCLPITDKNAVISHLIAGFDVKPRPSDRFGGYQEPIKAYFDGQPVDFSRIPVSLPQFGPFHHTVLRKLQLLSYGKTISYSELAALASRPRAIRAAAGAVAKNPLPLIVPCHRVIGKDGSLGGFSAPGGLDTKKRLLRLESMGNV